MIPNHAPHMITNDQREYYGIAVKYLLSRRERTEGGGQRYPLNRGDILLLVVLLEQELKSASPCADVKRLGAIREKLGDLVPDAPEMSKEEAEPFR